MSNMSILQIVQSTLGAMDSDAVSTIGETIESEQISLLCREVYLELATYQRVPQFEKLTQLRGLNDTTRATVMAIPDGATDIADIRYRTWQDDGTTRMVEMRFIENPSDFLSAQLQLGVGSDNVGENILPDNVRIPYWNDRAPTCWTTFDNELLVFDAVDGLTIGDKTLHNDASMCMAYVVPEFLLEDDFVPDLPLKLIPQYMNQIKELAFNEQKQIPNPTRSRHAEREGHRNRHFGGITDGLDQSSSQTKRTPYGRRTSGSNFNGRVWPRSG